MPWAPTRRNSVFSPTSSPVGPIAGSGFSGGGFATGGSSGGGTTVGTSDHQYDEFPTGPFIPAPAGAATSGTSSLQRAFPERIGGNLLATPNEQPSLIEQGMVAQARVGAQPIALADTLLGGGLSRGAQAINDSTDGIIGNLLGVAGSGIERVFSLPAAIMNSAPSQVMSKLWNKGDDTVLTPELLAQNGIAPNMAQQFRKNGLPVLGWLGVTGDQMTVGDLKKELEGRGFLQNAETGQEMSWEEFAHTVNNDPLGAFQQGHARVNENVVSDLALQSAAQVLELAPLGWIASGVSLAAKGTSMGAKVIEAAQKVDLAARGLGPIAKSVAGRIEPVLDFGVPNVFRMGSKVGDGAVRQLTEKAVIDPVAKGVAEGATELAAGSARGVSMKGWAQFAKKALYPDIPGLTPFQRYLVGQTGVRTTLFAGEALTSEAEKALGGGKTDVPIISNMHDFFEAVMNDDIVSNDALFSTITAFRYPVREGIARSPVGAVVRPAKAFLVDRSVNGTMNRALDEIDKEFGKGTVEKLGGRTEAGIWMDRVAQTIAYENLMKGLPEGLRTRWESIPEASLRMKIIHSAVRAKADFMIRMGQVSGHDLVQKFRDVHERPVRSFEREDGTLQREPILPYKTTLSTDTIVKRANAYTAASKAITDPIVGMQTAVLGRAPFMAKEDLQFAIQTLKDSAIKGEVDSQFIRDLFYDTPGLLDDPLVSAETHQFFVDAMNPANDHMWPVDDVVKRLDELKPPTRDELWHELYERDKAADLPRENEDVGPVTNGVARNVHSAETAKRFVSEADSRVRVLKGQRAGLMERYKSMFSKRGRIKPSVSDLNWKSRAPEIAVEMAYKQAEHYSAVSGKPRLYRRGYDVPGDRLGIVEASDADGMLAAARAVRTEFPGADVRLAPSVDHPGYLDVTGSYHFTNEPAAQAKAAELGSSAYYDASKAVEPRIPAYPPVQVAKPVMDAKIAEIVSAMPKLAPDQAEAAGELLRVMAQNHARYNGGSPVDYLNNLSFVKGGRRGAGALRQIELELQPAKPTEIAKRLRYQDQIAAGQGYPLEPGRVIAGGTHAVGHVTPEQWLKMVDNVLTKSEAETARNWYASLNKTFEDMFGTEQGPKMLAGFLMSQQRVSPSQGFRSVLMALDELVSGTPGDRTLGGSLAHKRIRAAVKGGFGALSGSDKIWDFADSGSGKLTRSFMQDQGGLQPAAIDVWAARDMGWVDKSVNETFGEPVNIPSANGTLNDLQYEAGVKFYNDMATYLSDQNYLGHSDWTAPQAQALGWVRVQKAMGDIPEGIDEIMNRNAAKLASEVGSEPLREAVNMLGSVSAVEKGRHMEVVASPDSVRNLVDILSHETGQNVTAVHGRHGTSGGTRQHISEIKGDFRKIADELAPILPDGYTIQEVDGGAIVFGPEGTKTIPVKIRNEIDQRFAEKEFYYAEVARNTHDFEADPAGSAILDSIRQRGRPDVADTLASRQGGDRAPRVFQQLSEGVTKGSIEWDAQMKSIIRGYKTADLSTFVHEMGHQLRRDLHPNDQVIAEVQYGVKDGNWTRRHEERFARDFERYLRDGRAPTDAIRDVFAKIATWMRDIYATLKGTPLEKEVSPEIRQIFDRALGKVDEPARVDVPGVSPVAQPVPVKFEREDPALLLEREAMRDQIRATDREISRTKNDIAAVRARAKALKGNLNNLDDSFRDMNSDGTPKASTADVRRLRQYTDYVRENYPMFQVEAGPRMMNLYEPDSNLVKNLMLENDATMHFLSNWGPFSKMHNAIRAAVDAAVRPVRGRAESTDTTSRIYEVLMKLGAKETEVDRFLENVNNVLLNERTIGLRHEQLPITRGMNAMGARQLTQQGIEAMNGNSAFVANFEKRYGGKGLERMYVPISEAYNPVIRAIQRKIESGGKVNRAQRLMDSAYDAYHTDKGFANMAVATHAIAKWFYPLVRFTANPLYHVYNATEADIIALTQDGMRVRRGRTPTSAEVFRTVERGNPEARAGLSMQDRRMKQMGLDPALDAYTDELIRNATLDQTGVTFGYNSRRAALMERQVDLARPETIKDAIAQFAADDPAIQAALKRYGGSVDDWVDGLTQDIYGIDKDGARKYIADLITEQGWSKEEMAAMQPLVSEITNKMQKSFDDIYEMHVGNINRSRAERMINSYWLFWPASYMLKANKWMFKVLTEGAFGKKTNLGGAYTLNQLANIYHQKYTTDDDFRQMVDDNKDVMFMLSSVLPVAPWSDGVSLNRLSRYIGGTVGLWPQYTNFDLTDVTSWSAKMSDIGPVYAFGLAGDVSKNIAKDLNWEGGPLGILQSSQQETPQNPIAVPGL